ncbi:MULTISPECIES: hypothetical protein [unclassified Janthinobacterium]|uniref:hypothetical protein n=1 Tax=unclassified Janthinobacterium TaxID=2610881 RepID=UPI0018C9F79E|nr:hypothetical protein [Janthinobacterium sp. CG_23.4]MDH6157440.1 hypothetical protein [Janthinobacterium sp. CG_23.4]
MKYTPKNKVKVEGKMNPKDAGIVGKRLAAAAVIAATGIAIGSACAGLALTLKLFLQ